MKRRDLVTSIILLALSVATFIEMKRSDLPVGTASSPEVGFFPLLILILLGLLSLILLITTIKGKSETVSPSWAGAGGFGSIILTVGLLFLYGYFFEPLGYLITTFLLIGFLVGVIGRRKLWVVVTVALASTVVSYVLFDILLKAQLPLGILKVIMGR